MEKTSLDPSQQNTTAAPPNIYPWDVGPAVARMQELLRAHGFPLRVDGDYGWRTEIAVKNFQRQYGLRIDGVVGPETWATLMSTVKPGSRTMRQGCSGADVFELQGLLQVNGYVIKRTGNFDSATKSAVITFQREHHLHDDGIVDSVTWALLCNKKPAGRPANSRRFFRGRRKP